MRLGDEIGNGALSCGFARHASYSAHSRYGSATRKSGHFNTSQKIGGVFGQHGVDGHAAA